MKKVLFLLVLMLLATTIFAQDSSSDTLTVESKGYGSSKKEAVKDAIRNAAESSVGVLITSNTLIENYVTIKDQILTSANAYVYRYEEKQSGFDKNTGIYTVTIKAYVSKKLLLKNTNAKINKKLKLDMTAIEKTKFEMEQSRERAVSAITYLGAFVQKHFRETFIVTADSLTLTNKDLMKMTVDANIYGTADLKNKEDFIADYLKLSERVKEYVGKQVDLQSEFDVIVYVKNSDYDKKIRYHYSAENQKNLRDGYYGDTNWYNQQFALHLLFKSGKKNNFEEVSLSTINDDDHYNFKYPLNFIIPNSYINFRGLRDVSLKDLDKIHIDIKYSATIFIGNDISIPLFENNQDINIKKIKL